MCGVCVWCVCVVWCGEGRGVVWLGGVVCGVVVWLGVCGEVWCGVVWCGVGRCGWVVLGGVVLCGRGGGRSMSESLCVICKVN